jgi:hypothetical protein
MRRERSAAGRRHLAAIGTKRAYRVQMEASGVGHEQPVTSGTEFAKAVGSSDK